MTTANAIPTAAEQMIHQRLDAIDRALLGWLPRTERLALVSQIEARARDLGAKCAAPDMNAAGTANCLELAEAAPSAWGAWSLSSPIFQTACRRRSRMAITAAALGIAALVLLFATPMTYFAAEFLGEFIGEIAAISMLGVHLGLVTLGGMAAVTLGIAALVSIKRRRGALAGHAWAITGLCTGPWPMLGGAVVGLIVGMQLVGSTTMTVSVSEEGGSPATASYSAPEGIYLEPENGLPVPTCMPAPLASHPSAPRCMAEPPARVSVGPDELVREAPPFEPGESVPADLPPRREPPVQPPVPGTTDEAPASENEPRPEPPAVP
jgi:hypothetical protein